MSNKNYYMPNNSGNRNPVHDVTEKIEQEIKEVEEAVVIETEAEEEEYVEKGETEVGVVTGCVKLNIRKESTKNSDVVCTVPEKAVLLIDINESTDEWYRVTTDSGFNGYCMKQYVSVNQ